jgi:hypothetical protein
MTLCPYGFRIVGACTEARRWVNADAAFDGYAACDGRAEVDREAYLSAFTFGGDFRELLTEVGSCRGYDGACGACWLWFDIDRPDDLAAALADARRLALSLVERYRLDDVDVLAFYSGAKGFHVALPTALWGPEASTQFHRAARRLAEQLAARVSVAIDAGIYDKVRPFRAPNTGRSNAP